MSTIPAATYADAEESGVASLRSVEGRDEQATAPAAISARVPGGRMPNFIEQIARKKLGQSDDWEICIWESIDRGEIRGRPPLGCIVSGGVPRIVTRGKRKGQNSWSHIKKRDLLRTAVMTVEEDAAKRTYEAKTANCWRCGGGGEQWAGWSAAEGTRYRTCLRCNGTGDAPTAKTES